MCERFLFDIIMLILVQLNQGVFIFIFKTEIIMNTCHSLIIFKHLLIVVLTISKAFSGTILIFLCVLIFKQNIKGLLEVLCHFIKRLSELNFKNLGVLLRDEHVSDENKNLLLRRYLKIDVKDALEVLMEVIKGFEFLNDELNNRRYGTDYNKLKKDVVALLKDLAFRLQLLGEQAGFTEIIPLINEAAEKLAEKPECLDASAQPIINSMGVLRGEYFGWSPSDFQVLKEIKETLLKIYNSYVY